LNFASLFLPGGLVVAMAGGLFLPEVGVAVDGLNVAGWTIKDVALFIVFLITGLGLSLADFKPTRPLVATLVTALVINLVLGPLAALALVLALPLPRGAEIGFLAMSCVPTTLSSATVIVRNVGGNTSWSVLITLALTIVGTVLLPLTLSLVVGAGGGVKLDMAALLLSLAALVAVPLAIGMTARTYLPKSRPKWFNFTPSVCIIIVVFLSVCRNVESLWGLEVLQLLSYLGLGVTAHGILLLAGGFGSRMLHLDGPGRLALVLTASQKTLPLSLTALVALESSLNGDGEFGLAVVVCVLYHLQQILMDSAIAAPLARRWKIRATHA